MAQTIITLTDNNYASKLGNNGKKSVLKKIL